MAKGDKQLFAPAPIRAMAMDLSGLEGRVLMCVASHDRLSLVKGKGQGCRASNTRMCAMVNCNYARLCVTLTKLVSRGLLLRERLGKHTIYRVIYTDDDTLLFGNPSEFERRSQRTSQVEQTGCPNNLGSGRKVAKTPQQYIPLNGEKDSDESGKENAFEKAGSARQELEQLRGQDIPRGGIGRTRRCMSVGEILDDADVVRSAMQLSEHFMGG